MSGGSDDKARFAAQVLPHLDSAYVLARWLTGDGAAAENVVHEACWRAFDAIGKFAGDDARIRMLTIVRHTAYAWLDRKRRAVRTAAGDRKAAKRAQAIDGAGCGPAPSGGAIAPTLDQAIAALPPSLRETLVLRDLNGLNYQEIAQVTGTPVGTVLSRLAGARRRLIAMPTSEPRR